MTMALTILQLISAVTVTLVVLFQSGKRSGLSGSISGGAETFLSRVRLVQLMPSSQKQQSG